ncbi:hypothetical protein NEF87_002202 [Candidatus Lokiarchaeum ossiferum]|uniref:Uncharacterized protein n=1 Tax=Candidatus Lokiarchaeum ossiferum TaxID=2951803 RepID=A0ABY6HQY3_9ARCH|nr:hypothetical protein NEF87_002202 [Candidatus Lokiarchaeum sp. B-35]
MEDSHLTPPHPKPEFIPQVSLLQIIGYFFFIVAIWAIPIASVLMLGIIYIKRVLIPDIQIYANPLLVVQNAFNGNVKFLLISLATPAGILLLYLFELFLVALLTKIFIGYCNYLSPEKEMVGAKGLGGDEQRDVDIYHLRGAIYRIMKWIFARCPFPWLIKWAFSFAGNNKYGKGTVLEDQYYCQEFFETGENVYIDKLAIVSSHLVEGAYGAITLKKVHVGDNCVIGANVGVSPGAFMEPNSEIVNNSMVPKFKKFKSGAKYHGIPVKKMSLEEYEQLLHLTTTDKSNPANIKQIQQNETEQR